MIPLSVFIVTPDGDAAARLSRVVVDAGHAPTVMREGERAIDRFIQDPADVVVVEYVLPGRDGVATLESIRWAPSGRDVHVVLFASREPEGRSLHELAARVDPLAVLIGPEADRGLARVLRGLSSRPKQEATRVVAASDYVDHVALSGLHMPQVDDGNAPERPTAPHGMVVDRHALGLAPRVDATITSEITAPVVQSPPFDPKGPPPITTVTHQEGPQLRESVTVIDTTSRPAPRPEGRVRASGADPSAELEAAEVREHARVSATTALSAGRLEDTTLAELLTHLADDRATGALVCTLEQPPEGGPRRETTDGEPPTKIVYFKAGVPVHVRSNLLDECLGRILLKRRRIGLATLEESIRRMRAGDGLQGEILIDMGAMSALEVSEAVAEQARTKIVELFGWSRGSHRFAPELEAPDEGASLEIALPELVYEGIVEALPAPRLLDILEPHLLSRVVPVAQRLARFARVRVAEDVRPALAQLDGRATLRDTLSRGARPGAIAQVVYALYCLGAVRFEGVRSVRPAEVRARVSAASEERETVSRSDEMPVLEVRSARDLLTPPPAPPPIAHLPSSDSLDAQVSRPASIPPAPSSIPPGSISPDSSRHGSGAHGSSPPSSSAPPSATASSEDEAWDDETARLASARGLVISKTRGTDSSGVHASPEVDVSVREAMDEVADEEDPIDARPRTAAEASREVSLDRTLDRLFTAERHFRRGNRALDRGRHDEALAAFLRAAELCPDQGEFVAYVGWARHCLAPEDPGATAHALSDLARAVEVAPELHLTHLLLARVQVHAGLREEARRSFARVVQIDAGNEEARLALLELG